MPAQKATLEAIAEARRVSISAIIRQLIDTSLTPPVTELSYLGDAYKAGHISLKEIMALLSQIVHDTNVAIDKLSAHVSAESNPDPADSH